MRSLRDVLTESQNPNPKDLRVGQKIELEWSSKKDLDQGVITGIGADYIKFKLDKYKFNPHKDTGMIYFDEFKKYKLRATDK